MNYQLHYNKLIDRSKFRVLSGYKERHHIIPKCLGGSNHKSNIAELTSREHFIAHQLLAKMHPTVCGLMFALHMLTRSNGLHIRNNRMYSWLMEKRSKLQSERQTGKKRPYQKRSPMKEETKQKIGNAQIGEKNHRYGKTNSDYQKQQASLATTQMNQKRKEDNWKMPEFARKRMTESAKIRVVSEETKKKISDTMKLRRQEKFWSSKGIT